MGGRGRGVSPVGAKGSSRKEEEAEVALECGLSMARDGDLPGAADSFHPAFVEGPPRDGRPEGPGQMRPSFVPVEALPREHAPLRAGGIEVDSESREEVLT